MSQDTAILHLTAGHNGAAMTFASGLSGLDLNARPDSIWDIVEARARELGDKTYVDFIDLGRTLTYRETAERASAIGRGLLEMGVESGDKVGLLLSGSPVHVLAWFATIGASMVDVPINPDSRGDVLDHAITKIDVSAIFADADGLTALGSASEASRARISLLIVPDDVHASATRHGEVPGEIGRFVSLSELEEAGRASKRVPLPVNPRALTSIRFSSGTTGLPKGVMMDHGHMLASARKFNDMMDYGRDDTLYTCFPFHHVFATVTGVLSTMCTGGRLIVARKFSASRYWKDIRDHEVTRAQVLDPLVALLLKQPASELDRAHRVPVMYTAAGYYPEFEERFGVRITSLYDMSELTVVAHYPPGVARRAGSWAPFRPLRRGDPGRRRMPAAGWDRRGRGGTAAISQHHVHGVLQRRRPDRRALERPVVPHG